MFEKIVQDWGFGVGSRVMVEGCGLKVLDWIVVGVGVYDWGQGGVSMPGKPVQNWVLE
jgi:hypothetical protein